MTTLDHTPTLTAIACYKCGIDFGVPESWKAKRKNDHKTFWCPNGHSQRYTGPTDADEQRAHAATKGQLTKSRNGVCPCCNRTFSNVQRHVATQHSDYVEDVLRRMAAELEAGQ